MLKHDLIRQLENADRQSQRQLGLAFLLRASKYVGAALVGLFALDVALHLEARWRAVLTAGFVLAGIALCAWAWYVARVRRNRLERTARLLESRDETLGSKLINFLQLREGIESQPALTRQLGERALEDYSARLAQTDFTPLTRLPGMPRERRRAAWGLGACALALAVCFPISVLELLRFADPFGDHPPYSLTRVEIAEPAADGAVVTYNQEIVVKARTAGHRPDELFLSFYDPAKPAEVHTVPMYSKGDLGFLQEVAGVKTDLFVYAHTRGGGSISKKRRLTVALTPKLDRAFVTVAPPPYTGLKATETPFGFKEVRALAGSEVKFRVRSNRPLSGGSIEFQGEGAAAAPVKLTPSADNEVSGALAAAESGRLKFALVDVAQNVSQQPLSAALTVTHDLPPDVRIENPTTDSYVCEDFKVEARITATDDYGVKTVRIHRALNDHFSAPLTTNYEQTQTGVTERTDFDIKDLGVAPGDMISFFAEAVDNCPEPHLSRSETIHLMVISTDEYNDSLRERSDISDLEAKYSDLLGQFHDLVDEQKALAETLKDLQKKLAEGGDAKDLQAKLDQATAKQSELNQKLAEMADHMDKFVRDKPLYDVEKDMGEILKQKAAEMRASLAQNNEALKQSAAEMSQQEKPAQEKRLHALESLSKQADQQLAKLDQTRQETEQQILPPLQDAEKMNALIDDLNQFKRCYEAQQAAEEQTKPFMGVASLSDTDRLALKQLAGTEKAMEDTLQRIAADLRTHAKEAEEIFPQAADSARAFADAMEKEDLRAFARRAASNMLAGNGERSWLAAKQLRYEMEKFFEDTQPKPMGGMCQEMDKRLKLRRNLTAGETFKQMAQGRKPGYGQGGVGSGIQGQGGMDGYAASAGQSFGMLGGETFAGQSQRPGSGNHGQARAAGPGQVARLDPAQGLEGIQSANRNTGDVQTENTVEGYRNVIDAYFNTITK